MVKPDSRLWRGNSRVALVLASASPTRARLLANAGVAFEVEPANADEASLKVALKAEGASGREAALALAALKARQVSAKRPDALVLGCDQLLDCDGAWFDKAIDRADAKRQLLALSGRAHELATAACVMRGGVSLWHHSEAPKLIMRSLDAARIEAYLDVALEEAIGCVGAYRLEGVGAQLFSRIEGDYFAILGLPLLPLLDFLRNQELVP